MEIFRDLFIRCGDDQGLFSLLEEIGRHLPPHWSRDTEAGKYGEDMGRDGHDLRHFRSEGCDRFPPCELVFIRQGPGSVNVANIVFSRAGGFTIGDYNAAMEDFCDIARPHAEKAGATLDLTSEQFDINEWLSVAAARKLRDFSRLANKGLGGALPVDHSRWLDFVVTAHRDGCKLPATTLRRWLVEEAGWDFDDADRLAGEYAFGGEVLSLSQGQIA